MHTEPSPDTFQALQTLIERSTGTRLGADVQAEMRALLREHTAVNVPGPSEMTLLVAGVRGLPDLLAIQPQDAAVAAINRCLLRLAEVVAKHRGSIHHFARDALLVLFGAPEAGADDVERAVLCAVELQMVMRDLNQEHLNERLPPLFLGVGVHTGTVMAGRFGSPVYSEFMVLGDEVELASRIQAFSLRGQVLISDATYQRCWGMASASAPMQVYLKGRRKPARAGGRAFAQAEGTPTGVPPQPSGGRTAGVRVPPCAGWHRHAGALAGYRARYRLPRPAGDDAGTTTAAR
jgi:adenylate cyclase